MHPPTGFSACRTAPRPVAGVLLINVGAPVSPGPAAVRAWIGRTLGDPRLVSLPRPLWLPLLHGLIANLLAIRASRAWRDIWLPEGSPPVHQSRQLATAVQKRLDRRFGPALAVVSAMRHGRPDIAAALEQLADAGVRRLLVLPLHPQYSGPTVGSALDGVSAALSRHRCVPELRFVSGYHDHPGYIAALAESVRRHWLALGGQRHLVIAGMGIPPALVDRGDPYPRQVRETAELVARALQLGPDQWSLAFQSRMLPGRRLQPTLDAVLTSLAAGGARRISVIAPVFPTDGVETLYGLGVRAVAQFRRAGGESLSIVPALNDGVSHVEFLADLIQEQTVGWLGRGQVVPWPALRLVNAPKSGPRAN